MIDRRRPRLATLATNQSLQPIMWKGKINLDLFPRRVHVFATRRDDSSKLTVLMIDCELGTSQENSKIKIRSATRTHHRLSRDPTKFDLPFVCGREVVLTTVQQQHHAEHNRHNIRQKISQIYHIDTETTKTNKFTTTATTTTAATPTMDNDDSNIPVAIATPYAPPSSTNPKATAPPNSRGETTLLQKGRSHRVMVPSQPSSKQLSGSEIAGLKAQGYTSGLIRSIARNNMTFPLRIWVVDNSGSMTVHDGHRMVELPGSSPNNRVVKFVDCSRWTEIQQTVEYHARMAALLEAPTVFRLLNDPGKMCGPQQFSVAEHGPSSIDEDLAVALQTMQNATPSGVTPLAEHVREIRSNVVAMQSQLLENGQKCCIVLATDGLPSNAFGLTDQSTRAEFQSALRSLEGLPVWIVIRLCTDEEQVVDYYNNLDSELELSLEVIDDFAGEAAEVYEHNKWLNYALPLHRIREMGFSHKLFDLLDERPLSIDELRQFFFLLFGPDRFDGVPDPQLDFHGFIRHLDAIVKSEPNEWNPITKRMSPWVDIKKLTKMYGGGSGCRIM
jgi:hypothetical protein